MKTPLLIILFVLSAVSASVDSDLDSYLDSDLDSYSEEHVDSEEALDSYSKEDPTTPSDTSASEESAEPTAADATTTASDDLVEETAPSVIHPDLFDKLNENKDSWANVFITMNDSESPSHVLNSINSQTHPNKESKREAMVSELKKHSKRSHDTLRKKLESFGMKHGEHFLSFWINNEMVVWGANMTLLRKLDKLKGSKINIIKEEMIFPIIDKVESVVDSASIASTPGTVQWGVAKMQCPKVWATGFTGQGVIVSTIDTGVRYTHEALFNGFIGPYGWFDPSGKTATPNDANGHGTHTMGTLCGTANGIGVAPGAQWMACKGCANSSCYQSDLIACGQWITCPTLADGTAANCSKAPSIVSNSWAGGVGGTWFDSILAAWSTAGIASTFAIGNTGTGCGTTNYPGNSPNTIGVGSTDSNDVISYFSSCGPTTSGAIKPDFSGPGSSVNSSYSTSDTSYATLSGTSMACPHVAGLIALLFSKQRMNNTQLLTCLKNGAVPGTSSNATCGGVSDTTYPNNQFGYGRVDANKTFTVCQFT